MIMLNLIGVFALKLKCFIRFSLYYRDPDVKKEQFRKCQLFIDLNIEHHHNTNTVPKHRMSNTKKQRTEHGAVPGIGNNMNVVPQQLQHTKKAPEFELPVASIVRLVKRVRDYLFQSCCCF